MKQKLLFLIKYFFYWVFLSLLAKGIFLLYQGGESFRLSVGDYFNIFLRGLQLDFSLAAYIGIIACLILAVASFAGEKIVRRLFAVLTLVLLLFFAVVMTVDLELFKNWGFHIDATPLLYLKTPKEAMASTPVGLIVGLVAFMLLFIAGAFWFYQRCIGRSLRYSGKDWRGIAVFLLLGGFMIIPVRGGFNVAPMNVSFVYFHPKSMLANQAAVNPVWNFIYELLHMGKFEDDFDFMSRERSVQIVDSLQKADAAFPRILNTQRPNIVLLLMESFTANAIGALGGVKGITPNLDSLAKEGILFSNIYSTAGRSDRGMAAAISAFPSHPNIPMLKYPNKTLAHPRFPKDLENIGYSTRFYYAGDINFGGFRSYVTMSFQDMVTEVDFTGEAREKRFKWGIHDEYMYQRLYEDMKKAREPFMYMAFNLDSHEPFEVPGTAKIPGDDMEHKFMNAVWYTDSCVGNFISQCKASGIWDNTLFIIMADHGVRHIGSPDPDSPEAYHIPLILTGGAVNVHDTVVATIGSQTDMVATLFAQLGIDHSAYKYSRNLLADDVIPFAFYSYSNAAGVVSEHGVSVLDLKSLEYTKTDSLNKNGELLKAYLQSVTTDLK